MGTTSTFLLQEKHLQKIGVLCMEKRENLNPFEDTPFWGSSQIREASFPPPPILNLLHKSHNDETCHSYSSPREDPKNHATHLLRSTDISIF